MRCWEASLRRHWDHPQCPSVSFYRSRRSPTSYPRVRPLPRIGCEYHNSIVVQYLSYNVKAVSHVKHVASVLHIESHLNAKDENKIRSSNRCIDLGQSLARAAGCTNYTSCTVRDNQRLCCPSQVLCYDSSSARKRAPCSLAVASVYV
jgi:hypothetical protein